MRRLFSADGEDERFSVEGCRNCGGYVKRVLTPVALVADRLVTEDLATLHLDALAVTEGYASNPEWD